MADEFVEKRQHSRVRSRLPIDYKNLRGEAKAQRGTLTRDISEGGIRFLSDEFLSLANRLVININIPTAARQVKAITKIAWIKKLPSADRYEVGNQFIEMSKEDREEIARYVNTVIELDITY
jgi:c-di-GMP-binding flagellar brake protein YcgR